MARSVKVTPGAVETATSGGGDFKPLPAGKYNVSIFDHSVRQYGEKSNNVGRDFLALHLRVSDGQKGANRRLFTNVGDFEKWANKDGSDVKDANGVLQATGSVNFLYYQFYKALGVDFSGEEAALPDYEDLNGEEFTVKVKIVADKFQYEKAVKEGTVGDRTQADFLKNEVAEFLPLEDIETGADEAGDLDEDDFDL